MKNLNPIFSRGIVLLCILLLNYSRSVAQFNNSTLVSKLWEHTTGTPDTIDWSSSILDGSGNLIVVGNTMVTTNNTDMLITKYASDGTVIWQVQYNNTNNNRDYGVAVAADASNNIYVAGTSITSSGNGYDWVIQKYDINGSLIWQAIYNGPGSSYDVPTDMVLDGAGSLYVVGASYGTTTLSDYCTRKYNATTGSFIWEARYDYASLLDIPAAITLGASARVYVTGGSASSISNWDFATVRYNATTGAQISATRNTSSSLGLDHPTALAKDQYDNIYVTGAATNGTQYDIKTVKLDDELNTLWSVTWDNVGLDDQANSIGVDVNGYVYLTGYTKKTNGGSDFITIKYNSSGTLQWDNFYSAPDESKSAIARKLDIDPFGDAIITGDVYNIGNKDFLTLAYDTEGDIKWEEWYSGIGNGNDIPMAVKVGIDNFVYVTGKVWTGTQYSYLTVKYEMIDYINPTDAEYCPNNFAFYENKGQIAGTDHSVQSGIKFVSPSLFPAVYLQNDKCSFVFSQIDGSISTTDVLHRIDLSFLNNLSTKVYKTSFQVPGYNNYYLPHCSDGATGVRGYSKILCPNIYSNIDLLYSSNSVGLKYYFICKPISRPGDIIFKFTGASSMSILTNGKLKISSSIGDCIFDQPTVFQQNADGSITTLTWVPVYTSAGTNKVSLTLQSYDINKPLIITIKQGSGAGAPTFAGCGTGTDNKNWSTFFGGNNDEVINDISVDEVNNSYSTGHTYSDATIFPITT
ncbi:MAG: hypothetical protein ABI729_07335, partial [Chitinophagales bacterium]